ncbi:hypothetical protein BN1723_015499 [Verticillium longisporum]|uniref:Uncharacterized protein n=1 Tax=Verticillium longisporum TaxID=100787 RepID=A0A0G4MYQ1_VERLO|nr:hypothetical protein BN1723_015499 [Verticillium longisporum]
MDREGDYAREGQAYYGRSVTGGPAPSAATTAATTPQYRPGTPNTDNAGRNPFGDGLESQASVRSAIPTGASTHHVFTASKTERWGVCTWYYLEPDTPVPEWDDMQQNWRQS